MKIYYDKELLTKEHRLYILGIDVAEEDIEKEFVVYEGEEVFSGHPYVEGNTLRQATLEECVKLGYVTLEDGQYAKHNDIITVDMDCTLVKPQWDDKEWIETATEEEIEIAEVERLEKDLEHCRQYLLNIEIETIALERIGLAPTEEYTRLKEELLTEHNTLSERLAFKLNKI